MMKKLILLISIFYSTLFGYEYDKLLLKAQANIFPKFILLDKDLSKKVKDNEIVFCIVHHESDTLKSSNLKKIIVEKFGNKLQQYNFKVISKEFDKVKASDNVNAYYILQGSSEKIKNICDIAEKKNIPTFSYDLKSFADNVLISMTIQNNPSIYLNKRVNKAYSINFVDIFYQIVKIYDK